MASKFGVWVAQIVTPSEDWVRNDNDQQLLFDTWQEAVVMAAQLNDKLAAAPTGVYSAMPFDEAVSARRKRIADELERAKAIHAKEMEAEERRWAEKLAARHR